MTKEKFFITTITIWIFTIRLSQK